MKAIHHRGYVIEWIRFRNDWRVYRQESERNTVAYVDDPAEAVRRIDEEELRHG